MTPKLLEAIMFLQENRRLWSDQTIRAAHLKKKSPQTQEIIDGEKEDQMHVNQLADFEEAQWLDK